MIRAVPVPPQDLDALWPFVEPYLDAACRRGVGDVTTDGLLDILKQAAACLALALDEQGRIRAAIVTQMIHQPDGRSVCRILALGGTGMNQWIGLLDEIERGARQAGAAAIRFEGRVGWARVLSDYAVRQVVFEKDLRH